MNVYFYFYKNHVYHTVRGSTERKHALCIVPIPISIWAQVSETPCVIICTKDIWVLPWRTRYMFYRKLAGLLGCRTRRKTGSRREWTRSSYTNHMRWNLDKVRGDEKTLHLKAGTCEGKSKGRNWRIGIRSLNFKAQGVGGVKEEAQGDLREHKN
jgi:hypothetical protein